MPSPQVEVEQSALQVEDSPESSQASPAAALTMPSPQLALEQSALQLADFIRKNVHIRSLDLTDNCLSGTSALAAALRVPARLQVLELKLNGFDEGGARVLQTAAAQGNVILGI